MHSRTRIAMRVTKYRHPYLGISIAEDYRRIFERGLIIPALLKQNLGNRTISFQGTVFLYCIYALIFSSIGICILMRSHDTYCKKHASEQTAKQV